MIDALQQLYSDGWTTTKIAKAIHAPHHTIMGWKGGQNPAQDRRQQLRAIATNAPTYYVLEPVAKFWRVIGLYATQGAAEQHRSTCSEAYRHSKASTVLVSGAPWFLGERLEMREIEYHGGEWVGDRRAA